jgi:hypothetical protein
MLKSYEISGADLPIYSEKKEYHFYLDGLKILGETLEIYEIVAYVQTEVNGEIFFKPVYSKKEKSSVFYKVGEGKLIMFPGKASYEVE